jgi:hypothetical protein
MSKGMFYICGTQLEQLLITQRGQLLHTQHFCMRSRLNAGKLPLSDEGSCNQTSGCRLLIVLVLRACRVQVANYTSAD